MSSIVLDRLLRMAFDESNIAAACPCVVSCRPNIEDRPAQRFRRGAGSVRDVTAYGDVNGFAVEWSRDFLPNRAAIETERNQVTAYIPISLSVGTSSPPPPVPIFPTHSCPRVLAEIGLFRS